MILVYPFILIKHTANIYIYIYIYIHQVTLKAWIPPLSIRSFHSSLLLGYPDYIQCPHRADICPCWSGNTGASMCSSPLENLPHLLIIFFLCWSCKGIKGRRKKTGILLDSNFILGVYKNSVVGMFFWTSGNSRAPSVKTFEEHHGIIFSKFQVWGTITSLCVQWVRSTEAATYRRHKALLRPWDSVSTYAHYLQ